MLSIYFLKVLNFEIKFMKKFYITILFSTFIPVAVETSEKRLAKYRLKLNEEKTRLVQFSKREYKRGKRQQTFDFLGFTFYLGKSRKGITIPKVKTSGKRMRDKLKRVDEWCRKVRNQYRLMQIWKMCCAKLRGHIEYYGVSFNVRNVQIFLHQVKKILFKWLNRRSQKRTFNWDRYNIFLKRYPLPEARRVHSFYSAV
jgi:RNA-directed DNA polymerase